MILLDTNVLVRANDQNHPEQTIANTSIQKLLARGEILVLVPQVLYEWWVVATRPRNVNGLGIGFAKASSTLANMESSFEIRFDDASVYSRWRDLIAQFGVSGKNAHDVRLVAAMQVHGIDELLTFNCRDFTRFISVNVIAPVDVA